MQASNRVALITGCAKAKGIGAASARVLSASGVTVVVSDLNMRGVVDAHGSQADMDQSWRGLESLVDEIVLAGGAASWVEGDVSSETDVAAMVNEVLKRYGRLDILVSNAGAPQGNDRLDIEQVTLAAWEQVMAINARGTFLMCRYAVAPMRKQGWGRIINMSSASAKYGRPRWAVYSASKAAIVGFSRSLAVEVAPFGITVNAICPGPILTARALSSARRESGQVDTQAGLMNAASRVPVGRLGRPEEVASIVGYLASESSAFVTGQAISVCGGLT